MSYLVPGFLVSTLIENTLYLKKNKLNTAVLNYLIFSLINITMFTFIDELYIGMFKNPIITNEIFIVFFRSLFLPLLIWMIVMRLYKSNKGKSILHAIGLSKVQLTETSWDYLFYEISQKGGAYIIITLRNDTHIYGLIGPNSFISAHKEGTNDIYVEDIFENNDFEKSIGSGLLIFEKDIMAIYHCHNTEKEANKK